MSSISSRNFTVKVVDALETEPRAVRRVICNADILKVAKICAGDIVALSSGSTLPTGKVKITLRSLDVAQNNSNWLLF